MIEMRTLDTEKNGVTDITEEVIAILYKSGVKDGILTVEVPHSTAGVVATSHFDPKVRLDVMNEIKRLVPSRITFKHEESPDDAAGHIKCAMFGNAITSIVKDGALVNDNVLHYFFMEYDGPRTRKYFVSVISDK